MTLKKPLANYAGSLKEVQSGDYIDPSVIENGVPAGGSAGQLLTKVSSTDYATAWTTQNGVTSITGTANQVIASSSTGDVTLSLPQSINSGASPTFNGSNFTGIPSAGVTYSYATKTSAYSILSTDYTIGGDATSASFAVTLPTAVGKTGQSFVIKKIDSSANTVTVATTSSQTIDGATTYVMGYQYQSVTVQSNGSNWLILSERLVTTWQAI